MGWVNYFFAGFVIMKLPFPLTDGFKSMLQNGIMTPNLNVRYVSSISWYFVNLFGLRPVYSILMGSSEADEIMKQASQQQQTPMPNIGGPGGPKADKVLLLKRKIFKFWIMSRFMMELLRDLLKFMDRR